MNKVDENNSDNEDGMVVMGNEHLTTNDGLVITQVEPSMM